MKTIHKLTIMLASGIIGAFLVLLYTHMAYSQELVTDKIFNHHPNSDLYEYHTYYNGTLVEKSNFKQIIIYKWNQLGGNAKEIITESMRLQGYNATGIGEHDPQ